MALHHHTPAQRAGIKRAKQTPAGIRAKGKPFRKKTTIRRTTR